LVNPALNWNVTYSEKGKPEFLHDKVFKFANCSNCNTNIHFNISHSANYVACAIADSPVGIDIEGRRKVNSAVAKRYFTDEEIESIHSDEDFFKIWTFKEALGKYTGDGLLPVIGKSERDVLDDVSVNHYVYEGFQICVVTGKR
jgi:4'-phosphopantetheinyl transferase